MVPNATKQLERWFLLKVFKIFQSDSRKQCGILQVIQSINVVFCRTEIASEIEGIAFFNYSIWQVFFFAFIKTNEWQTPSLWSAFHWKSSFQRLQPKSQMDSSFLCWSWCQTYGSISPGMHGVPKSRLFNFKLKPDFSDNGPYIFLKMA